MDGIQNYNYIDNDNKENKFNFRMEIMKIHPLKFILIKLLILNIKLFIVSINIIYQNILKIILEQTILI